jgi:hypothetical protein
MLTLKNVYFVKLSKCGMDFTIVFCHRDSQKTYMERLIRSRDEGVMPPEKCSVVGTFDPSRDFRPKSGLPTVGTSDPNRDF